jgi:hypothetical protein
MWSVPDYERARSMHFTKRFPKPSLRLPQTMPLVSSNTWGLYPLNKENAIP